MYVCEKCLKENYSNVWLEIGLSVGCCEVCLDDALCGDYHHNILKRKDVSMKDIDRVARFILKKKEEGETHLGVIEVLIGIGISKEQIGIIMEQFEKEGKIKSWIPPKDGEIEL